MATRTLPIASAPGAVASGAVTSGAVASGGCCDTTLVPSLSYAEADQLSTEMTLLAHPVRLLILDILSRNEGQVCVCDLEAAVPVKQPTVSHHLRLLREAGLVDSERHGPWAYYFVRRDALEELRSRMSSRLSALG